MSPTDNRLFILYFRYVFVGNCRFEIDGDLFYSPSKIEYDAFLSIATCELYLACPFSKVLFWSLSKNDDSVIK